MKQVINSWIKETPKSFCETGLKKLISYWNKCISVSSDYIEK